MSNILTLPNTELKHIRQIIEVSRIKKKAVPKKTRDKIIDLILSGHDPTLLCKSLGVAKRTMNRWCSHLVYSKPMMPHGK